MAERTLLGADRPLFAVLVPLVARDGDALSAVNVSLARTLGVFAGVFLGLGLRQLDLPSTTLVALLLVLSLAAGVVLRVKDGPLNNQVAITALFMLYVGASQRAQMVGVARIWETALGAGLAVAVSTLVWPPDPLGTARSAHPRSTLQRSTIRARSASRSSCARWSTTSLRPEERSLTASPCAAQLYRVTTVSRETNSVAAGSQAVPGAEGCPICRSYSQPPAARSALAARPSARFPRESAYAFGGRMGGTSDGSEATRAEEGNDGDSLSRRRRSCGKPAAPKRACTEGRRHDVIRHVRARFCN